MVKNRSLAIGELIDPAVVAQHDVSALAAGQVVGACGE